MTWKYGPSADAIPSLRTAPAPQGAHGPGLQAEGLCVALPDGWLLKQPTDVGLDVLS